MKDNNSLGKITHHLGTTQACLGGANAKNSCCPKQDKDSMSRSPLRQPFVNGLVQTSVGQVPQVSSALIWADYWGTIKARWAVGRMHYTVEPGLYALGRPDNQAPVLVTANYKMSFDRLREGLLGRDAWILVLDTKGINVWCAAAKGTFGTEELVKRVEKTRLAQVVVHREIVLPQLAGPGVAAHVVKKLSDFKVIYGPIRAKDLPVFIDRGFKALPEMRQKRFTIWERVVLIPVELVGVFKAAIFIIPLLFFLGGLGSRDAYWVAALNHGLFAVFAFLSAVTAGAILTPLLLPWLPGRAFSLKGLSTGLIAALILAVFRTGAFHTVAGRLEILAWFFLVPAVSAYLAMNFTGSSTYTSLSGVSREMKWAVPFEITGGLVGLGLWLGSRFLT